MNFKKFNGSTWETVRHKIYGSGTDSLTAFPAQIQASGEPLTDYLISGNTVQDGTPTPEAPVDVVGCGERTWNLFDKNATDITNGYAIDYFLFITGDTSYYKAWRISEYIPVSSNVNYYLKWDSRESVSASAPSMCFYRSDKSYIGGINYKNYTGLTFTTPNNTAYIRFSFIQNQVDHIMLNSGSTALPYEPYGYKIPITVNGTEYPIYLGQVPTTRRIKKLVLTGNEVFDKNSTSSTNYLYYAQKATILPNSGWRIPVLCNALPVKSDPPISNIGINSTNTFGVVYFNFGSDIMNAQSSGNTVAGLKEYLAAQYANGTPVTVWYVLAEPETGIVNEPLHRIGDYADTITMAQAGVTIPTSDGDNAISFGMTVHPSAMSATFKGWHPVQGAKQYDGSEWR